MTPDLLPKLERAHVGVALALAALFGLGAGPAGFMSAAAGALITAANLNLLSRAGRRACDRAAAAGEGSGAAAGLLAVFLVKLPALFLAVYAALKFLDVSPLPFAVGLCAFAPASVWVALQARADEAIEVEA